MTLLRHLSEATAESGDVGSPPPSLEEGLARLGRVARPGTLVFVLSDFHDLDDAVERELGRLARRCDLACLLVHDALEASAPAPGDYRISDGERVLRLPTESDAWRREYAERFSARRTRLETFCARRGAAFLPLQTGEDSRSVLRADRFARAFRGARTPGGRA